MHATHLHCPQCRAAQPIRFEPLLAGESSLGTRISCARCARHAFTLIRPADVTATIETPSGTRIRALQLGTLDPGQVPITWDGLDASGRPAFAGRYELRVAATNELGTVQLVTQLTVRRVSARTPGRR